MRFLAVVLVAVMVIGGMLGLVLQQRAIESPRLSAPVAATPQQSVPTSTLPTTPQPAPSPVASGERTLTPTAPPAPAPEPIAAPPQTVPQVKKPESLTRVNEANYVQITITPVSLKDDRGMISFEVSLNTHSVDLSRYKIEKLTRLVIDGQSLIVDGFQWESKLDDSHHRSGVLKLPATDAQGKERITSETKTMTIEISGIAGNGVRSFSWTAPASLLQ